MFLPLLLGLAAAGCSDGVPRPGSADVHASKKVALEKGAVGFLDSGPKTGDVGAVRTRGKGSGSLPLGLPGKTRSK
jgi:hypothetical protein